MIVYPALDLFNEMVVKLNPSRTGTERVYGHPLTVAERWCKEGAEWVQITDLNASTGQGRPNFLALARLTDFLGEAGVRIRFGGGVRDDDTLRLLLEWEERGGERIENPESAADLILERLNEQIESMQDSKARAILEKALGNLEEKRRPKVRGKIEEVTIGTRAVGDPAWLEAAARRHSGRIVVCTDRPEFVGRTADLPLAGYLYCGDDGNLAETLIRESAKPVTVRTDAESLDEVRRLQDLGAAGVVLGSGLYGEKYALGGVLEISKG